MTDLSRILIVDDSPLIHSMYRLVLNHYKGCEIVDAMNGLEALDILSRGDNFNFILLDINMPVMNGVQFLEKLRKENIHRHLPVIIISTEGKEEDTLRALKLGAWGYIIKPFKPPVLYEIIDKVMARKSPFLEALLK